MLQRLSLPVIATLILAIALSAEALVLCVNPSGALSAGAQCKPGTVRVDPSALGLVGPAGAQGSQGPQGIEGPQGPAGLTGYTTVTAECTYIQEVALYQSCFAYCPSIEDASGVARFARALGGGFAGPGRVLAIIDSKPFFAPDGRMAWEAVTTQGEFFGTLPQPRMVDYRAYAVCAYTE